jgi:hypothetical protein
MLSIADVEDALRRRDNVGELINMSRSPAKISESLPLAGNRCGFAGDAVIGGIKR